MNSARSVATRTARLVAFTVVAVLGLAACGGGSSGAADKPARTINIEMQDISFSPSAVTVKKDEEIRFVFTNNGKVQHDAFIGSEMEQKSHEAEMRGQKSGSGGMGGMDHGGSADSGVTVQPGKSDEIAIAFGSKGKQIIGCHEPGHYAGGMKITVTVE